MCVLAVGKAWLVLATVNLPCYKLDNPWGRASPESRVQCISQLVCQAYCHSQDIQDVQT